MCVIIPGLPLLVNLTHKYMIDGEIMKTLREMMDIVEGNATIVSDNDLAGLLHDIVIHLIFNKQSMSIRDNDPTLVTKEVKKAYKLEGIPFTQNDLDRVSMLFPKVMKKLRKGFSKEYRPGDND
jgi:hypothetical protein